MTHSFAGPSLCPLCAIFGIREQGRAGSLGRAETPSGCCWGWAMHWAGRSSMLGCLTPAWDWWVRGTDETCSLDTTAARADVLESKEGELSCVGWRESFCPSHLISLDAFIKKCDVQETGLFYSALFILKEMSEIPRKQEMRRESPSPDLVVSREGQKATAWSLSEQSCWQDLCPYLTSYRGDGTADRMMDSVSIIHPDKVFWACLDVWVVIRESVWAYGNQQEFVPMDLGPDFTL